MWGCVCAKLFGHFGDTCRSECIMKNKRMNKWTIQDGKSFQGFWCPTSNTAAQWISWDRREGWYDGERRRWRGEIKRKVRGGCILSAQLSGMSTRWGGRAACVSFLFIVPYIVTEPIIDATCWLVALEMTSTAIMALAWGSRSERVPIPCFPCGKTRSRNAIKTCIRWWVNCVTLGKLILEIHLVLRDCPPLPHPSNLNSGNKAPFYLPNLIPKQNFSAVMQKWDVAVTLYITWPTRWFRAVLQG